MFFHRKKKPVEKTVAFHKRVDVLNYIPREYTISRRWALFSDVDRFAYIHSRKIQKLDCDEMNGDMFDSYIASEAELMKNWADEQHAHHKTLIEHNTGILAGEITALTQMLEGLKEDLEEVNTNITELEAKKGVKND